MVNNENNSLEELTKLLKENLELYKQDREIALKNYNLLKTQLQEIHAQDNLMSEDAALEKQLNIALSLVFKSGERLDNIIQTITRVIITQLNTQSREKIAQQLKDTIPQKPINFAQLLVHTNQNNDE